MSESRAWEFPMLQLEDRESRRKQDAQHPGTELSDFEVIRVLEARPRVRVEQAAEAPVGAPRPVVSELALPTRSAQASAPKPAPVTKPAPAMKPREERDSLAETLNELRKFAFDLESDDTGSTTGVRHLQVELDEPASSRKSRGPRR